ncbi:MAG: sulfite exporter TauE/SafE family protein [Verrucomicrobiota bacterium]
MNWPFIIGALAAAGFVQGLTGFGFGLISMSLLPAVLGLKQAAAIGTFYGLLVIIATFVQHFRDYKWRLGIPFLVSCCIGVPFGVYFLENLNEELLLKILGAVMVYFAAREFFIKKPLRSISTPMSIPFGVFSGVLSGAFNLGGIPTATYAYAHPWTRGQIMAFLQTMLILSCTLRLFLYGKVGYLKEFSWAFGAVVAVPLFGAMFLGNFVMNRVHPKHMRKAIFVFIGAAGFYYLLWH